MHSTVSRGKTLNEFGTINAQNSIAMDNAGLGNINAQYSIAMDNAGLGNINAHVSRVTILVVAGIIAIVL